MRIFLVGPPGVGKSTVGRLLADELGLAFWDLDEMVSREARRSIADIFAREGEEAFRELEGRMLAGIAADGVVATGGGVVLREENRRLLREGTTVYLRAAGGELRRRLGEGRGRPLLEGRPHELERLLRERERLYEAVATITVDTTGLEPRQVAERLAGCLRARPLGSGVWLGKGLLDNAGLFISPARRIFLVSDERVDALYGERARRALRSAGHEVVSALIRPGESSKTLSQAERLYHLALAGAIERSSAVVALGGGVVGDLAGFVAATLLRGLDFYQVPTTLLAQVDSSLGGKTGVDLPEGKNLVGAFHLPRAVLLDPDLLSTLTEYDRLEGLAEVAKYGLMGDAELFVALGRGRPSTEWLVERSAAAKLRVVAADFREESGERALLNLGHTVGHAVERATDFAWSHGRAVSVGLVAAAHLSKRLGVFRDEPAEVERVLKRLGLPVRLPPVRYSELRSAMSFDKKVRGGRLRFVLLRRIGEAFLKEIADEGALRSVLLELGAAE